MDWSLIISVISIIIAAIALIKSFIDGREHCKIVLEQGSSSFWVTDNSNEARVFETPGILIRVINTCRRPIAIDHGRVIVKEWNNDHDLNFDRFKGYKKSDSPMEKDKIIIQPGQRITNDVNNIFLADETIYYNTKLCDIKVRVCVFTESGKVFHSKPFIVTKQELEEARDLEDYIMVMM